MTTGPADNGDTTPAAGSAVPAGPPDHDPPAAAPPAHEPAPPLDPLPAVSTLAQLKSGGAAGPAADAEERVRWWPAASVARGLALFFGAFTLLNVAGTLRTPAFDGNVWWIDPPDLPRPAAVALFTVAGALLVAYAVAPRMRAWRRWTTFVLVLALAAAAVYDVVQFYRVWRSGLIEPAVPLPLSLLVALLLGFVAWAAFRTAARPRRGWPAPVLVAATVALCLMLFPLAQVLFFGTTDYRRPADVAVVFGAQVHRDGAPSTSLTDRVDTAVALYKDGTVEHLLMSGGVGDSGYNEALVMRDMAEERGVPTKDIVIDSNGVSTEATVADTVPFFGGDGWRRIIAVSQFYHLPRVKMAYQRAGWDVLTVPARSSRPIKETPRLVVREIPAFWVYYLRAVAG